MQTQGEQPSTPKPVGGMPATDDEIREKYLERAIRELNHFTRDLQACDRCPRGNLMPVLGSGHPQADVLLLKHAPTPAEVEEGVARLIEEIAIVQPKIVVVMGPDALDVLNDLQLPLAREVREEPGIVQRLTPSIEALYVPDIDRSLDEESAKREFWRAFRELGTWWSDFPPY